MTGGGTGIGLASVRAFLELGALAAWDEYDGVVPSAGIITGIGVGQAFHPAGFAGFDGLVLRVAPRSISSTASTDAAVRPATAVRRQGTAPGW